MAIHKDLTGEAALHQLFHHSETDPTTTLGAYKGWIKPSTGEAWVRNAANSAWISITIPAASETTSGKIELATSAETNTGTDAIRAVTPATLAGRTADETRAGIIEIATQTETDAGTDDTRAVTPAKLDAWAGGGGGGSSDLEGLSDVDLTSPAARQGLFYDGTNFVNQNDPAQFVAPVAKSATFTALLAEHSYICDASGGAFTANLPTAVGCAGKQFIFKKSDTGSNAVTIDPSGSQTIDGATTVLLDNAYEGLTVTSDGANWHGEARPYQGVSTNADEVNFTPAGTIAATNVQDAIEEVASEAGGSSVLQRSHNCGNPQSGFGTPSTTLYFGYQFTATAPNIRITGGVIRQTPSAVTYTLYLRTTAAPGTILASAGVTGDGSPKKIVFGSAVNLTPYTTYEIGVGVALAANARYVNTADFGGDGPDIAWADNMTVATSSDGSTGRSNSTSFGPALRIDYEEY